MATLGSHSFNHEHGSGSEEEYDRLRDASRQERSKYQHCASESRKAYERGDGGRAHELSEEGKQHAQKADGFNKQASEYIFRENNAVGKVASDTIDLHGQFVEEAEQIVQQRIRYAQQTGQTHLHVIVGKGNHSVNHVQKIKPAVEQICQELGLQYHTEENEGRMYVNLTGGPAEPPANYQHGPGQYEQEHFGKPHYETAYPMGSGPQYNAGYQGGQQGYQSQQQPQYSNNNNNYNNYNNNNNNNNQQGNQGVDYEAIAKKNLPKIIRLIQKNCCTVM